MKILVTSPMRTGSTWVHEVLASMIVPERVDYVSTVTEALTVLESCTSCVLKSHGLADSDIQTLRSKAHCIRVLRNYKDSLISRALYCRNVRPAENEPNSPGEDALIRECAGMTDQQFANAFLTKCPFVQRWIDEIVIFERGTYDHTFYYEMLLHNPRDQFQAWVEKVGLQSVVSVEAIQNALDACSFRTMRKAKTPGFVGSTGVGVWMHWLDESLSRDLDRLYFKQRDLVLANQIVRDSPAGPTNPNASNLD